MAPTPIPPVLPPWAKVLLQVLPFIASGLQEVLDHTGEMRPVADENPSSWRRVALRWHPNANPDPAEVLITTIDIVNITGGDVDSTWTAADYTTVDTALVTLVAAWNTYMQNRYTHFERAYYRMQFNPLSNPKPFAPTGAPEHVVTDNQMGTLNTYQASQVAVTHTELTPYRKHWGRSYWPAPGGGNVDSTGHIGSAMVSAWANAVRTCYQTLQNAQFYPVVVVTQVEKAPARGLLTVQSVQVDNVYDVIRRRRAHETTLIARAGAGELEMLGTLAPTLETQPARAAA